MKENPYRAGLWDMEPIPETGPVFSTGDRVVTRGIRKLHGTIVGCFVQPVQKSHEGLWEPAQASGTMIEVLTIEFDDPDTGLRPTRGQDLDFES